MTTHTDAGVVIRRAELDFATEDGCLVSRPVGPHVGAEYVSVDIVRVSRGATWRYGAYAMEETTAIVFEGSGRGMVGSVSNEVTKGSTVYGPTGHAVAFTAESEELTVYLWRAVLPEGAPTGSSPTLFNTVHDTSAGIRNFGGTGEIEPVDSTVRAYMNFPHWPGNGCAHLCINSGVAASGHTFNIHGHPGAEDALFALEGSGQFFLGDTWLDMEPGDGVFARAGSLHGTRNPEGRGTDGMFVSVGGPVPFDASLYEAAGLSPEVV